MNPFFLINALPQLLWSSAFFLVWAVVGLALYGCLFDRAVFEGRGQVRSERFGSVDALVAGGLLLMFALLAISGFASAAPATVASKLPDNTAMILGVVLSTLLFTALIVGIVGGLIWRKLPWTEIFGLRRVSFPGVLGRGVLLLLLAIPLIQVALVATHLLLSAAGHAEGGAQEIVRFLSAPGTGPARVVVAISAAVCAPIQEEFIFRGYLYGVLRKYAGVPVGLLVNALLFAGIHVHAPSFGGLFILAVCLTLAYEWTGSIFVPITMHALFNTISLVNLFHGGDL